MKKKLLCPLKLALLTGFGIIFPLTFLLAGTNSGSDYFENHSNTFAETPPVFIDPVPNDTIVSCESHIPVAMDLMAMDDMGNTFSVTPTEAPNPATIDPCTGGSFTRSWVAIAGSDTTTAAQLITITPDNDAPVANIPVLTDTVSCELSSLMSDVNPLRFDVWVNSARVALATMATDNCSGIDNIIDDAPNDFEAHCGTISVTFTIIDNCGATTDWVSSFTTIDTVAPVLIDVPNDTIIACSEAIPYDTLVTAIDNCAGILDVTFQEVSTQLMNGMCNEYEYYLLRTWSATDSCGNTTEAQQLVSIRDDLAPTFTAPPNLILTCTEDPLDLNVTGNISNVSDNCSPLEEIEITHLDEIIPGGCEFNYTITRVWRARDLCGNVTGKIQTITVIDNEAPTFDVPGDIVVDCSESGDMNITGLATNLADNCTADLEATFSDVVIAGACINSYTIQRTWRVEDLCGNFTELDQFISVTDNDGPAFTSMPQNKTIFCAENQEVDILFHNWIVDMAGAEASDNCTEEGNIQWSVFNSGTINAPVLPSISCPAGSDTIRKQAIDVIIEDECGNQTIQTVTFSLIDNIAPEVRDCPEDITIPTDPGDCNAVFTLLPPVIEEECSFGTLPENLSSTLPVTSSALPGEEGTTPVDPIQFNLNVTQPAPVNAQGVASISITLTSVDGEEATEFFNILGEDGSLLGVTNNTDIQCGNSVTTFTIPATLINEWAADGVITITLEPNIPVGLDGKFAINAICNPAGSVGINLSFLVKSLGDIVFKYRIDDAPAIPGSLPGPFTTSLSQGEHLITYYATDCAGNIDSCSYSVTVVDEEAPLLNCPSDIVLEVTEDSCSTVFTLPLPQGAIDNCDAYDNYADTLPIDTTAALITFSYDPNLNDFIADERTFVFTGVAANAFNPVELTIDFLGDFNTNGAYMTILGDDGSILAVTTIGAADCSTPGQVTITIPAATFNQWATDGIVEIITLPNEINVPPGVTGDGINPCTPGAVNNTGEDDGSSYIFATLSYDRLSLSYFTEGETQIPLTQMAEPLVRPTVEFGIGETEISYIMSDQSGNVDSCSYLITVEDNIPPVANCVSATTLFIEPSGLQVEILDASELDLGSTDNCGIKQRLLSPNTFDCSDIGDLLFATLTVIDSSGNAASCETIVSIAPQGPVPTANSGLCAGDSLFLFANPPVDNGGVLYTFQWYGPNDVLFSVEENPVIPNIDVDDEGGYRVVIRGLTGCEAEGVIFVSVEALPATPVIEAMNTICLEEDLLLSTPNFPAGNNVTFYWYEGMPPNGALLGTTTEPELTLFGPHAPGTRNFYMAVEATGCISAPASPVQVLAVQKPIAEVSFQDTTVCEGEIINIGTLVSGPGITYQWTGPNVFSSNAQFPEVGPLETVNEGYYYLVLDQSNGCFSEPDSVRITIKDKPETPAISNSGPVCAGEELTLTTTATGASSYHWVNMNGEEFITSFPTFVISAAELGDAGEWHIFVVKNDCVSDNSFPVNVEVNTVPVATANVDPEAPCDGDSFQLVGGPNLNGGSYQWTGPGISTLFTQSPVINNASETNEGIFLLTATSEAGCSDTASVYLEVPEKINILGVSSDAASCLNGPTDIHLDVTVLPFDDGSYTYSWEGPGFSQTTNTSTATIPNATGALNRGDYYLTVTSGDGCEVVLTDAYFLDIRDIPANPGAPNPSDPLNEYCVGEPITLTTDFYMGNEVTYYWNIPGGGTLNSDEPTLHITDATVSNSGPYSVYVLVDGCISGNSLATSVTVHPIPQVTVSTNSPVCYGDDIDLQTEFFQDATYQWQGPDGFNAGIQNPTNSSTHQMDSLGVYWVISTVNGCTSDTAFVTVAVKPIPEIPIPLASITDSICASIANASLALSIEGTSATVGALYTWYNDSNGQNPISSESDQSQLVINDFSPYGSDGLYDFYIQANLDECLSDISESIPVLISYIPALSPFAGTDDTVCDDETAELNGETPAIGTGAWTLTGGPSEGINIANPNQAETAINGLNVPGSPFTFTWTLSNGACIDYASDEVILTVSQGETAFANENIIACEGEIINLSATPPIGPGSIGIWTQPDAQQLFGVIILEPDNPSTIIEELVPDNLYNFTWTIVSDCGMVSDEVIVFISDPSPEAGADAIACNEEATGIIMAEEPTRGSQGQWSSTDDDILIDDIYSDTTTVSNLSPGENIFIWTIDDAICGDQSRDTIIVFFKEPPTAIDDIINISFDQPVTFDPLANDITPPNSTPVISSFPPLGEVSEENGLFTYTPPSNYVGTDDFLYEVVSEGCPSAEAKVSLVIGTGAQCIAPSIITPNNDGVNDNFVVPCLLNENDFPQSQVIIFNRWGDEVFRSQLPYKNNWNGQYNGEDLPAATYFYVVDFGNGEEPITGYVVIQR
jgi:gliding motility-associated-like protein